MRQWFEEQKPVDGEDLERHDKWLCMMWPRLHLLRELLSDDGVIFISIDDNEQHHLRMMMDEVFGESNLVAEIPWASGSPKNDTDISVQHEYIIGYARVRRHQNRRLRKSNYDDWFLEPSFAVRPQQLSSKGFSNPDNDPRGNWKLQTFHAPNIRPNLTYLIVNPMTGAEHWPPAGRCWRMTQAQFNLLMNDQRIMFGRRGNTMPQMKVFYDDVKDFGATPQSWWRGTEYGTSASGTSEFKGIFAQDRQFDYPKPTQLVKRILEMSTGPNDIVLDSFAGSGTTAHAVLALNKEDGGNRKFILVECEDYADSITAERVRRVIKGVPSAKDQTLRDGLGGEFTYCELGDEISIEKMLEGELPSYADVARFAIHNATGTAPDHVPDEFDDDLGFVYESDSTRYHIFYRADVDWLRGEQGALN